MNSKTCKTITATVYIAGDPSIARNVLQEYVMVGLCVTVMDCDFVYTGGRERGVAVGLANYPRFLTTKRKIRGHAIEIAKKLIGGLFQRSAMVVMDDQTTWINNKPAGAGEG